MPFCLVALLALTAFTGCPNQGVGDDDDTCDVDPLDLGLFNRPVAEACSTERTVVLPVPQECVDNPAAACSSHEDCTDGDNGRCTTGLWGANDCACSYDECFSDSDCPSGKLCGCGEAGAFGLYANNTCVTALCHTDADCDAGLCLAVPYYCAYTEVEPRHLVDRYQCATAEDECRNHGACECSDDPTNRCAPVDTEDQDGSWTCNQENHYDCD